MHVTPETTTPGRPRGTRLSVQPDEACMTAARSTEGLSGEQMKACTKCGGTKHFTEFGKQTNNKDGLDYWCKDCRAKGERCRRRQRCGYQRKYALRNPEKMKAYQCSDAKKATDRRCRAKHKFEAKAQNALNRAVRAGIIKKGNCRICGSQDTHAHHRDYTKALEVDWLCRIDHALIHRWLRTIERALDNSPQEKE